MIIKVFAVFDNKAASFGSPIFCVNRGIALRDFSDVCADPKSKLCVHPDDYALHELGAYDSNSGFITSHKTPDFIVSASDVISQLNAARLAPALPLPEEVPS